MDQLNYVMTQVAGLGDAQRLYRLRSDALEGCTVERWRGGDALGQHAWTDVDVLATRADIALDALPGTRATLVAQMADGGQWQRSGLIADASCLGGDGGLVRYRLQLVSWTWWLQHARHSRVFQEQSVRAIVDAVLAGHAGIARWRWAEGVDAFLGQRVRSYCVQYRESDLDFLQRVLAEEGLGWRLYADEEAPCGNGMEIFADSVALPEDATSAAAGVRFHRSDATESSDSVQAIGLRRRLASTSISLQSDDYRQVRALVAQSPMEGGGGQSSREDYDAVGAYAFSDSTAGARQARLQAQARESHSRGWQGSGTVRGFQSGQWLRLQQAPGATPPELLLVAVEHAGINNLPTDLRRSLDDALGVAPIDPADAALWQQAEATGYGNRFGAVDRTLPWRPLLQDGSGARLNPRPTVPGYQTAVVVAGDGGASKDLHADSHGRVRVRFHFQEGEGGGANDSAWLRVAQRYAGPGVGSQFLPRIGQEVLVGFLDGDIDRPLVLGTLYNGRGEAGVAPTPAGGSGQSDVSLYGQAADMRGSAQANLSGGQAPAWHAAGMGDQAHRQGGALWGIRSREWEGGQGANHLLFDDSNQQLRAQLASSQQVSQLTLGHLRHQADNYVGSLRGTGFELRSDAWGAVRATAGAWFSAYGRHPTAPAGEAVQPSALLAQLQTLGERFTQAARTHLTSPLAMQEGAGAKQRSVLVSDQSPLPGILKSVRTTLTGEGFDPATEQARKRNASPGDKRVPHSGDPLLGVAAPDGVVHVAGQSLQWSSGEGVLLSSGSHSDLAVMGQARLHASQALGMLAAASSGAGAASTTLVAVAGNGMVDVQAQADAIHVQARQSLRASSAQGVVEVEAGKVVHIATSGGAIITLEGGNITFACPGVITVHAGTKSFLGPAQFKTELPNWSQSDTSSWRLTGFSG
ncbi:type VI secretion system tip protein VgrG [Stenotrophomonas maltophilia]|uniref:type VI secretion system Vgr family protein n=1 Tax=Stenotrophomonas maltophilia TaxID=40324 RepID=UPI002096BA16|nr:type VI secretion system Vgr family protein [Stenotrophomonas maltophilia]MCO7397974.1 type VI secretion system tip protein VgrG [Stenotrophomonas maltophilia]MCO7410167.1 type VI secretion system tip protein VgrG [Stenotrophomonas maltophilia]